MKPNMRVPLCGLDLVNPVIAASGTFGYGVEFEEIVNLRRIGGLVTKGISAEPMAGNQSPRLIETAAGMINAIGLQNVGVEKFLADKLPPLRAYPSCAVIVNVFGYAINDYLAVIDRLNDAEGIAAYEINASCPNTKNGGIAFGSDVDMLFDLVSRAKSRSRRPVIVKLSPNVTSIALMASSAQNAGADAVSLVNTFLALPIDVKPAAPVSRTSPAASPVRPSNPSPCAWSGKRPKPSPSPSSDSAASSLPKTRSNFSSPEPLPSRSAPPATPIPAPPNASPRDSSSGAPAIT